MLGWRDCAKAPFPAPLLPGLTTAATIFSVASIGMAVGGGLYVVAIFACLLILVLLVVVGWLENLFSLKTRRMV
jgi:putative Mg2+ transporter-C (MgtC) family protein